MKNEEFDKIIKEKLLANESPPPANGWEGISAGLNQTGTFISWKIIAIAVVVLTMGGYLTYQFTLPATAVETAVITGAEDQYAEVLNESGNPVAVETTKGIDDCNNENLLVEESCNDELLVLAQSNGDQAQVVQNRVKLPSGRNASIDEVRGLSPVDENGKDSSPIMYLLPKHFQEEPSFLSTRVQYIGWENHANLMNEQPVNERHRVISGFYIDAQTFLNYNRISPNQNDEVLVASLGRNRLSDRVGFNFSAGVHQNISPRFSWYGGLVYQTYLSRVAYTYTNRQADFVEVSMENNTFVARPNVIEREDILEQRVNSLGMETGFKYLIPGRQFNNVINAALFGTTAINGQELNSINRQQLFLKVGYGAYYNTRTPWTIFAQPSMSYSLLSEENNNNIFHIKPFSLGLTLGLKYTFVK